MDGEKLSAFFANVEHLSKGEKAILSRNHASWKDSKYDVVMAIMKCVPDDEYVSEREYQRLLFIASVRCELGHSKTVYPENAVAEAVNKMQSGTTKFSDLLQQDAASGRVYPLMRRYLSMYNGPVNTGALYYDLLSWDTDVSRNADTKMPVKYKWANAFAKRNKK